MDMPDESPEAMFQRTLHIAESVARILTAGGITTLEELGYVPTGELLQVRGLHESDAQLLRKRAREYLLHGLNDGQDDGESIDA